jgi:DNA-3-methyladenine glycosylase II
VSAFDPGGICAKVHLPADECGTPLLMKPLFDPAAAAAHLGAADERLALVIARAASCPLRPKRLGSLFSVLFRAIVYQQLNAKAAGSILGRVEALFPGRRIEPAALLAMSEDALRGAGLSRNKLASVRDLAARTLDGTVPSPAAARRMADDELVARLTEVRGIGPWTVHMLLIFDLGRPDVMPSGDYGVRMGFKKLYRKRSEPTPEQIERHAARWQPYRSVAAWYLWRVHEIDLPARRSLRPARAK